ncbi:MAG: rhodanese-related sulfurtransferase [Bacteroidetes bacterium]|nr:rhodanese-related sulfurtransferase [Bacteroidota bacterium]
MSVLHNRISNKELKDKLYQENFPRTTISFYRYFNIQDPTLFRDDLYKGFNELQVFGRIYVATEGINAQISVPTHLFENYKAYLYSIPGLDGVRLNIAVNDNGKSFWVLRIKTRNKIVADGIEDSSFSMENKGKYVNAVQMNALLSSPETIVIDMRNHYEYEVGHFTNAIEIPSDTFREQLPMAADMMKEQKDKNIIMYCTGGIRCEKASAYMLHHGFKNVFHLEGGIINYANQIKEAALESQFKGKNFVFDERLGEKITEDIISKCHQCGSPCDTHTNCKNDGCHLLFIQCPSCAETYAGCCTQACTDIVHLPIEKQIELRKGIDKGQQIFNKSKQRLRPRLGIDI